MKKASDRIFLLAGLFLCLLAAGCLFVSPRKLTFLEYRMETNLRTVTLVQSGTEVSAIPCSDRNGSYEILESVTFDIIPGKALPATAQLCDESGKVIAEMGADIISDNSDALAEEGSHASETPDPESNSNIRFHIPVIKRPAHPETCSLVLRDAEGNATDYSDIASYTWFGGSKEFFWTGMCIFGIAFSLIYLFRVLYLMIRKREVHTDMWVDAMALAAVTFAVMCVLASECNPTIMDENDNIIGGILQTGNHTVLYRDYISQHMPAVYWLCALYALLGARSVGQFRLLFILTVSIIWGLVYLRHRNRRFVRAIVFFAICLGPFAFFLIGVNGGQILSDNVQAIAMTILLLEMMAYYEDHKLGIGRSLIVSACVFASVGSAFISIYAVFACMVAVIAEEIRYHLRNPKTPSYFIGRYMLLLVCVILPWAGAVGYLIANGALKDAFDMAFRFNIEVYPKYGMPGGNPIEPLYSGVINIAKLLRETFMPVAGEEVVIPRVVECCMIILTGILLIAAIFRRGIVPALGLFFFIETQATRTAIQFHSIMLWCVVFMFMLIELPGMDSHFTYGAERDLDKSGGSDVQRRSVRSSGISKLVMPCLYFAVILAVTGLPYAHNVWNVLRYRIAPVPTIEMQAVNDTKEGEKLFVECGMLETDYIFYKKRYPVSRLCWTLPWYYEWYGHETVRAVDENKTRVVVYKLNPYVWKIQDFATEMDALMLKDYARVGSLDLFERME